jgi:catechol 2,3-dioxygenase-like lactoylglutathione lyase family enzyme
MREVPVMNSVNELLAVELAVPDLAASRTFYEDVWGLTPTRAESKSAWFAGLGANFFLLALHERAAPGLVRVRLGAESREAVDALAQRAKQRGYDIAAAPAALREPGGGYGFVVLDPEGREFAVVCDVERRRPESTLRDRPIRLSHVVLNSTNGAAAVEFFTEALGFRLRDQTQKAWFLGCNADHHSIAVTNRSNSEVGHVAFELADLDGVLRGCGRLKKAGLEIGWGVGRHGTGDNVFAYFVDPDGFAIEYTAEMQQVDDASYVPGTPDSQSRVSHSDVWGLAGPPSERLLQALQGPSAASRRAPEAPGRKT